MIKTFSAIAVDTFDLCQVATHPSSEWRITEGLSDKWKANRENNAAFIEHCNPEFILKLLEVVDMLQDELVDAVFELYETPDGAREKIQQIEQSATQIFTPVDHSDKH